MELTKKSVSTKIISDHELQDYLDQGWELVNTFANPYPQPYFYALVKQHEHQFVIPVEWAIQYERDDMALNDDFAPGTANRKNVRILRCVCGEEIAR